MTLLYFIHIPFVVLFLAFTAALFLSHWHGRSKS